VPGASGARGAIIINNSSSSSSSSSSSTPPPERCNARAFLLELVAQLPGVDMASSQVQHALNAVTYSVSRRVHMRERGLTGFERFAMTDQLCVT